MKKSATERLSGIIESNEILKDIRRISSSINIDAVNAILLARRADQGRRNGFTVVAAEMRVFAGRLDEISRALLNNIRILVVNVSAQSKYERMSNFYRRLPQLTAGQAGPTVAQVLERAAVLHARRAAEIRRLITEISAMAESARKLCNNSAALYRNARVEVAYLPAYRQELSMVADRIESAMTNSSKKLSSLLNIMREFTGE